MHIHKFADLAVFDEVGVEGRSRRRQSTGILSKTSSGADTDRKADHPLLEVTYSYVTNRGNYKVAKNIFCCVPSMRI